MLELQLGGDGKVATVTVDRGAPVVEAPREIEVDGKTYTVTPVSMGNPHAVLYLDGIDGLDLPGIGPGFECHPIFPNRTNTEFVEITDRTHLRMRVWERGSGETLACGTGACAVLAPRCRRDGASGALKWPCWAACSVAAGTRPTDIST